MGLKRNNLAQTLTEYALVLAMIGLALSAMHFYAKRGLQAKVKNMSDRWISAEQDFRRDDGTYKPDSSASVSYENSNTNSTVIYADKNSAVAGLADSESYNNAVISVNSEAKVNKNLSFDASEDFYEDHFSENSTIISDIKENINSLNRIEDVAGYVSN